MWREFADVSVCQWSFSVEDSTRSTKWHRDGGKEGEGYFVCSTLESRENFTVRKPWRMSSSKHDDGCLQVKVTKKVLQRHPRTSR